MNKNIHYEDYLQILREELLPAMGCTEPITVALAAAKAKETLGVLPESIQLVVSGNIIKNVKSVIVPHTGGRKGLEAAAAIGAIAGHPDLMLEVISKVTPEEIEQLQAFMKTCQFEIIPANNGKVFYVKAVLRGDGHTASCEIVDFHTNITLVERDGEVVFRGERKAGEKTAQTDRSVLSVREIIEFADCVDPADLKETVGRQITLNTAISQEGLTGKWGAAVGKTVLRLHGEEDVAARACAAAAAGSDARMSGCEKPVVIVSGSGNQGMAASLPILEYAKKWKASEELTIRAVALSDLVTVHQKSYIGRLSAFCGAVSAGCGAAAGIAYLGGGRYDAISHTIANTLAICSGMICDGAKPSCAAKIASAVEAGLIGYRMYLNDRHQFRGGEGIVKKGVENTIKSVGQLAREGMCQTDEKILNIMVGKSDSEK